MVTRPLFTTSLWWSIIWILASISLFVTKSILDDYNVEIVDVIPASLNVTQTMPINHIPLTSGIGFVTADGAWGYVDSQDLKQDGHKHDDIKILGFTDEKYLPLAEFWYERMSTLGYNEHHIVAFDQASYDILYSKNYRVLQCIIENPDYARPVLGLGRQMWSARLHCTLDQLRNGTHVLITDLDNIFSRYVPLQGFLDEGYDVYHSYEMRFPTNIFDKFGFVLCAGHQFLRSSSETIHFMALVLDRCNSHKCNDQVAYNQVFFYDLNVTWDGGNDTPNHAKALRINSTHPENSNLLVESATGRSSVTNHTFKIWDRDFSWRLAGSIPELCPSINNWLGMPTKLDDALVGSGDKLQKKMAAFDVWDDLCLHKMV